MKYQSELIKEIVDKRGQKFPSRHYQSECVESWIEETKGSYPKLCDYEGEWLNYIVESPICEFPYVMLTDVTEATINNVVPYAYKSAILKGSTKYRDIDTGEFLETFEEGRNLELVSVKMPVLTTTGENLIDSEIIAGWLNTSNGEINNLTSTTTCATKDLIKVKPATQYSVYKEYNKRVLYAQFNEKQEFINFGTYTHNGFTTDSNAVYVRLFFETPVNEELKVMLYEGGYNSNISYEPYKSNILTVNEDVELGSVGEVEDELNSLTGQLTQRTETRAYQEGDESNSEVLTDMTNTRYKLPKEVIKTVDLSDNHVYSYKGTTHYDCSSAEGSLVPTLSIDVPTNLPAVVARQRVTIQELEKENVALKNEIEETANSSVNGDLELMSSQFELDFRLFEIEMNLDMPMMAMMRGVKSMAMTVYQQAKTLILAGKYEREDMEYKLNRYKAAGRITVEEYEELIALMDARELVD